MRLQVTVAFICVLFPKALALKCYECIPDGTGKCTDTQKDCPDQCASLTSTLYMGGAKTTEFSMKTCAAARECVTTSLNTGMVKNTVNSKCCSTALCNAQNLPALAKGSPNGKKCYACADDDCSRVLNCEGDEDQCISATVNAAGVQVKMKGCATKSICTADPSSLKAAGVTGGISCCEGNLCNSAAGVKLSLLFMLVPLLSSFFL